MILIYYYEYNYDGCMIEIIIINNHHNGYYCDYYHDHLFFLLLLFIAINIIIIIIIIIILIQLSIFLHYLSYHIHIKYCKYDNKDMK